MSKQVTMMPSVKYSRLPTSDTTEETATFDYSSPFSYDDQMSSHWKYRSAFTYNENLIEIGINKRVKTTQLSGDNVARALVYFGFFVVYIVTFPIMIWFSVKRIQMYERFVIFRLGRLHKSSGPGYVFMLPLLDRCHKIDVRLKAFSVPPKQVITGDGAIIEVGAEIYFQIVDAEKSVTNVQNLNQSTRILLQTAVCNILSQKCLAEIESERKVIAHTLLENSNKTCKSWGVEITRAELSQIKVLSEPPARPTPTLMMPPGLGQGLASGQGLSSALMQMASAVMNNKGGPEQQEAIAQAFQALSQHKVSDAESPQGVVTMSTQALTVRDDVDKQKHSIIPLQNLSPQNIISFIREVLNESLVQKVGATYHFIVNSEDGGVFHLDLKHGAGSIGQGVLPGGEPDVILSLSLADLQALLKGEVKPFEAYMSGRLQVTGDKSTALKLRELVKELQHHFNDNLFQEFLM